MAHSLLGGGKRLRPILLLWTMRAVARIPGRPADPARESAMMAACGLECLHTYSLIHDDLPAMDDDDLRRGRPSCHVAFDEATAILAGDALQALGFQWLAEASGPLAGRLVALVAAAVGPSGMAGGQQLDLDGEGEDLDAEAVERIHELKTGRLLAAALAAGGLLGGGNDVMVAGLAEAGIHLGLAFQGADDLLDLHGQAAALGKTPGKDSASGKATVIRSRGEAAAREWTEHHGRCGLELLRSLVGETDDAASLLALGEFLWRRES